MQSKPEMRPLHSRTPPRLWRCLGRKSIPLDSSKCRRGVCGGGGGGTVADDGEVGGGGAGPGGGAGVGGPGDHAPLAPLLPLLCAAAGHQSCEGTGGTYRCRSPAMLQALYISPQTCVCWGVGRGGGGEINTDVLLQLHLRMMRVPFAAPQTLHLIRSSSEEPAAARRTGRPAWLWEK